MDKVAEAYKTVRDATILNKELSTAEAIAVLATIHHEMLTDALANIKSNAMNT